MFQMPWFLLDQDGLLGHAKDRKFDQSTADRRFIHTPKDSASHTRCANGVRDQAKAMQI